MDGDMNMIHCMECLEGLKKLPEACIDSMVTDPPAGIGFMGKDWDSSKGGRDSWIAWLTEIMKESYRVLKPGAHILVWALPRTSHWTATAIEDAGLEVRDIVSHIFGSGFPKGMDVGEAIDKKLGAKREVVGRSKGNKNQHGFKFDDSGQSGGAYQPFFDVTSPATSEAKQWDGWHTSIKPATEHWILARKPIEGTVADNVLKYGVGGLNIDGCRVGTEEVKTTGKRNGTGNSLEYSKYTSPDGWEGNVHQGRFPANLILSHSEECGETCVEGCPIKMLDEQSGGTTNKNTRHLSGLSKEPSPRTGHDDSGGASRFFKTFNPESEGSQFMYCAKASKKDKGEFNDHVAVKNTKLMEYLIRLITPPGGVVLDPFAGSGSTLVAAKRGGWPFVGFELNPHYVEIAEKRLENDDNLSFDGRSCAGVVDRLGHVHGR